MLQDNEAARKVAGALPGIVKRIGVERAKGETVTIEIDTKRRAKYSRRDILRAVNAIKDQLPAGKIVVELNGREISRMDGAGGVRLIPARVMVPEDKKEAIKAAAREMREAAET